MKHPRIICLGFLFAALTPFNVFALPPDRVIRLHPKEDRFEKGYSGHWQVQSVDETIAQAQAFDSGEVFVQAKGKGSTLLVLKNNNLHQFKFWQVNVLPKEEKSIELDTHPPKQCACEKNEEGSWKCQINSRDCLKELRRFLLDAGWSVEQLALQYSVEGLQSLLAELQAALLSAGFEHMQLAFVGANLRITGKLADEKAWEQLVQILYRHMVGRLILDDQVERLH